MTTAKKPCTPTRLASAELWLKPKPCTLKHPGFKGLGVRRTESWSLWFRFSMPDVGVRELGVLGASRALLQDLRFNA